MILFLDMDGVLNHMGSGEYFWRTKFNRKTFMEGWDSLCPIACSNLNWLLEQLPNLRVVISSTWRDYYPLTDWEVKLGLTDLCPAMLGRISGKTRDLNLPRGIEIKSWLEEHDHLETPFVIFDDDRDMPGVESNFILVDNWTGLTMRHVHEAKRILSGLKT